MRFSEYRRLVSSDLYRMTGKVRLRLFLRHLFHGETYAYIFWLRTCRFARKNGILGYTVYPIAKLMLRRLRFKLGISIHPSTQIGSGLLILHHGGIVLNHQCVIGDNCTLCHGAGLGLTIPESSHEPLTLGSNVFIGPGAFLREGITIGNNVLIGANSVVAKDVPDNAVIVGNPGRILSFKGAAEYIRNADYDF
jgi:serine O-acetyltransferase